MIIEALRREGRIAFARFMEMALFAPNMGYYTRPRDAMETSDYYTSPGAHPLFGALVALQLEQVWRLSGEARPFWAIELGAGSGLLSRYIQNFAPNLSEAFRKALSFVVVDVHQNRSQLSRLDDLQWSWSNSVPFQKVKGCLVCNELLDCFPVHRVAMMQGKLREVYVAFRSGKFAEELDEPSTPLIEERLEEEGVLLDEGQYAEVNLLIRPWIESAWTALDCGVVLIFDYGDLASEMYLPRRRQGTITAYYRHVQSDDLYTRIGRQDMTSHVNFSAVISAAKQCGFHIAGFASQREFLLNLGFSSFLRDLSGLGLSQNLYDANRMGMMDLVKPDGLGSFKVLALSKGMPEAALHGFTRPNSLNLAQNTHTPLLTEEHFSLLKAKYPHLAWDWETLWQAQGSKKST